MSKLPLGCAIASLLAFAAPAAMAQPAGPGPRDVPARSLPVPTTPSPQVPDFRVRNRRQQR